MCNILHRPSIDSFVLQKIDPPSIPYLDLDQGMEDLGCAFILHHREPLQWS
jgi:hypothetical protein